MKFIVFFLLFNLSNVFAQEAIVVSAKKPEKKIIADNLELPAKVLANEEVKITTVVSEKIEGFFFNEGELINKIQDVGFDFDGIILNAAAYTHTSVGIADAIRGIASPVIEVHISNTKSREDFRKKSFISPHAKGVIQGFGLYSYDLAILSFLNN